MRRAIIAALIAAIGSAQLAGCASMGKTETGAVIGAGAGGLLGAAVGGRKGAAIGAILGAAAGAIIANYYDKQNATRAEAAQKYSYDARRDRLEIEGSTVNPQKILPGATVESTVQYTALAPSTTQAIKLTEVRTLVSGDDTVDLGKREVTRAQGTHTSTMKFTLPKDVSRGDYTLLTTVSDGKNTKTARTPFKVA